MFKGYRGVSGNIRRWHSAVEFSEFSRVSLDNRDSARCELA